MHDIPNNKQPADIAPIVKYLIAASELDLRANSYAPNVYKHKLRPSNVKNNESRLNDANNKTMNKVAKPIKIEYSHIMVWLV